MPNNGISTHKAFLARLVISSHDQVRGFCADKSNPEVFDDVNVYGNIYDSDIHHNYFGVYTYGAFNCLTERGALGRWVVWSRILTVHRRTFP